MISAEVPGGPAHAVQQVAAGQGHGEREGAHSYYSLVFSKEVRQLYNCGCTSFGFITVLQGVLHTFPLHAQQSPVSTGQPPKTTRPDTDSSAERRRTNQRQEQTEGKAPTTTH